MPLEERSIGKGIEQAIPLDTLTNARAAVLRLPGIQHYIDKSSEIAVDIDQSLDKMVGDVIQQLEAESTQMFAVNCMGWSDMQSQAFFSHPDRKPFKSKLGFSEDHSESYAQYVTIGRYLVLRYKNVSEQHRTGIANDQQEKDLRENVKMFYEGSKDLLFASRFFDHMDHVNGISPQDRLSGTIHPTQEMLDLMSEEVTSVATEQQVDPEALYQQVFAATEGGNFTAIRTFLNERKGEPTLRRALEAIWERRTSDRRFAVETLQILWDAEKYRLELGTPLDLLYKTAGLPDGTTCEARINDYLTRSDLVDEIWEHVQEEAPGIAQKVAKIEGPINYWDVKEAHATYASYPDMASSVDELEEKKVRVFSRLQSIFPLGFIDSPTSYIEAPTRIGANPRSINLPYRNENGQLVNINVLNLRDNEPRFAAVVGHEITHKLHHIVLLLAEQAGDVPSGSDNRVPIGVKEDFANMVASLIQNKISVVWQGDSSNNKQKIQERTAEKPRAYGSLNSAIEYRRLFVFALTQRAVRLEMEKMWSNGKSTPLTGQEANTLIDRFNPQIDAWYSEGVPVDFPHEWATDWRTNNVNSLWPLDGFSYLRRELANHSQSGEKEQQNEQTLGQERQVDMRTAFKERFGETWLLDQNARAVFLALLAETGKNHDSTTYGNFVLQADIEQIKQQLYHWGITEDLI